MTISIFWIDLVIPTSVGATTMLLLRICHLVRWRCRSAKRAKRVQVMLHYVIMRLLYFAGFAKPEWVRVSFSVR